MKENESEGIERNSMDPKEKKEIKRKNKEVGHREIGRSRENKKR